MWRFHQKGSMEVQGMAMKAGPWLSPPNGRGIVYTRGILRVINMRGTIKSDFIIPSLD